MGFAITVRGEQPVSQVLRHIGGDHPRRYGTAGEQHVHGHPMRAKVLRHDQSKRLGPGARRPVRDETADDPERGRHGVTRRDGRVPGTGP